MKIVQINTSCGRGSTGKICLDISQILSEQSIENYILYSSRSNGYELGIKCSDDKYIKLQALKSRVLGNYGFNSKKSTRKIIDELEKINPDIVHIHNIHGHDCNLEMLLKYFKKNQIKIIWTFHDCWTFTGYCTYFDMVKCDKWQEECQNCPQKSSFSWLFDNSKELFNKKKRLFEGLDLTIVTPSRWLADLVKKSFLKTYPIEVINNGINLDIFKPTESDFKIKQGFTNKKIILGVASVWEKRKGLDVFVELSQRLSDDYRIVLVGADSSQGIIPGNITCVKRTQNQQELAQIYSMADIFVNPTREENYPTVNMEALACGTPVLTFRTGGSPEILDETCGAVVECDDIGALEREIIRVCEYKPYSIESCLNKAKCFDKEEKFKRYLKLYKEISR